MDEKLNPKDKVLLMRDEREGNKLKVVKGIDKKVWSVLGHKRSIWLWNR
jgi:hypothetical protein